MIHRPLVSADRSNILRYTKLWNEDLWNMNLGKTSGHESALIQIRRYLDCQNSTLLFVPKELLHVLGSSSVYIDVDQLFLMRTSCGIERLRKLRKPRLGVPVTKASGNRNTFRDRLYSHFRLACPSWVCFWIAEAFGRIFRIRRGNLGSMVHDRDPVVPTNSPQSHRWSGFITCVSRHVNCELRRFIQNYRDPYIFSAPQLLYKS